MKTGRDEEGYGFIMGRGEGGAGEKGGEQLSWNLVLLEGQVGTWFCS